MNDEAVAHPLHWKKELGERADLERSYQELSGYTHFFTDAWRARIRFYQMRYDESWDLLDRAANGADQAPTDVPNLIRRFFVSVFSFYTALAERPITGKSALPNLQMPVVPPEVFDSYPELRKVIVAREGAEALLRLHSSEPEKAITIFREHIANHPSTVTGDQAYNYVGLAAGLQALGESDDALRNLENAGYVVQTAGPTLTQARSPPSSKVSTSTSGTSRPRRSGWNSFTCSPVPRSRRSSSKSARPRYWNVARHAAASYRSSLQSAPSSRSNSTSQGPTRS